MRGTLRTVPSGPLRAFTAARGGELGGPPSDLPASAPSGARPLDEHGGLDCVFQALEEAVLFLDPEGRVVLMNPAAAAVLGQPIDAAQGRPLGDVLAPSHPLLQALASPPAAGPWRQPLKLDTPEGVAREVRVAVTPMCEQGRLVGTVVAIQGVAATQAVDGLVQYSARLAQLTRLTSGVAHELKNPLHAMAIHLELLRGYLPADSRRAEESADVIAKEIRRLDRIVQGILKFLRAEALVLAPVAVSDLARDAIAALRTEAEMAGVRLVSVLEPDAPRVLMADGGCLQQALVHLGRNALQATPQGGQALLRVARSQRGEVVIRVEDAGAGVPEEDLEKVFRLHYTTRPDASGMGLPLAYRIVQLHGGDIRLQSRPGEGTTAIVTLPSALVADGSA